MFTCEMTSLLTLSEVMLFPIFLIRRPDDDLIGSKHVAKTYLVN